MEYHLLFEQLTDLMTSLNGFDIPQIFGTLAKMCKILRVSKGVTIFYDSPASEQAGKGEEFVCYDSGEVHNLVSTIRLETPAHIVIICNVYQAVGAEPLSDSERKQVETIQRMMLSYLNRTRQEEIIEKLTYRDNDGYYNLQYFYDRIMKLVRTGQIAGQTAVRLNLRQFSMVNEQVGRENADKVMRRYCRQLEEAFENQGVLCRLGGDNFVMLFDKKYLDAVTGCFRGKPVIYNKKYLLRIEVAAAAGIYTISGPDEVHSPGDVMERIIAAYLIAKKETTPDIIFYSDEIRRNKDKEMQLQKKFKSALKHEEFLVYYQPKVDIQTRELTGAEALCRWLHDGTLIPPMEFIPVLEQGTDICRLDFYMLDHVCRDIRRWLDEGKPLVRISVNLSRRHMMDPDLFDHLVEIIDRHQIPHEYLEIELTETTTDVEFKDLKRVVKSLQDIGISTSVDDFGVGYSSLNLLKEIPWNVLKLDKSILPASGEDIERGSKLFAHIIAMAHEIGLKCVAEGVETEEQLEIMRHYGCRIAQGFLFDKPLPVKEFENRMLSHKYA